MIDDGMLTHLLKDMEAFATAGGYAAYAYIDSDKHIQVVDRYPVAQDLIVARVIPGGGTMLYRDIPKGTTYKKETQE